MSSHIFGISNHLFFSGCKATSLYSFSNPLGRTVHFAGDGERNSFVRAPGPHPSASGVPLRAVGPHTLPSPHFNPLQHTSLQAIQSISHPFTPRALAVLTILTVLTSISHSFKQRGFSVSAMEPPLTQFKKSRIPNLLSGSEHELVFYWLGIEETPAGYQCPKLRKNDTIYQDMVLIICGGEDVQSVARQMLKHPWEFASIIATIDVQRFFAYVNRTREQKVGLAEMYQRTFGRSIADLSPCCTGSSSSPPYAPRVGTCSQSPDRTFYTIFCVVRYV